jgi:hypothetical protein
MFLWFMLLKLAKDGMLFAVIFEERLTKVMIRF